MFERLHVEELELRDREGHERLPDTEPGLRAWEQVAAWNEAGGERARCKRRLALLELRGKVSCEGDFDALRQRTSRSTA